MKFRAYGELLQYCNFSKIYHVNPSCFATPYAHFPPQRLGWTQTKAHSGRNLSRHRPPCGPTPWNHRQMQNHANPGKWTGQECCSNDGIEWAFLCRSETFWLFDCWLKWLCPALLRWHSSRQWGKIRTRTCDTQSEENQDWSRCVIGNRRCLSLSREQTGRCFCSFGERSRRNQQSLSPKCCFPNCFHLHLPSSSWKHFLHALMGSHGIRPHIFYMRPLFGQRDCGWMHWLRNWKTPHWTLHHFHLLRGFPDFKFCVFPCSGCRLGGRCRQKARCGCMFCSRRLSHSEGRLCW